MENAPPGNRQRSLFRCCRLYESAHRQFRPDKFATRAIALVLIIFEAHQDLNGWEARSVSDIHGIEVRTYANTEGELDLTGAADPVFARHMIITNRYDDGYWFSESVSHVLIPDLSFASDPGFGDSGRPARATAGVAT